MKTWVRRLGSMKLAIAVLVAVLASLAAGTIVESLRGSETAARAVYDALWFRGLLALYALNVACSLATLYPWGRQRIGFLLTHGSMLVILAGALLTLLFKIEGRLALWEGDSSATFTETARTGDLPNPRALPLPFSVRLDSFAVDHYPGTRRPSQFRSRVTVTDPRLGAPFQAVIEMNRELSHAGYRLYQSGYQEGPDRNQSVLLVSHDPGEPVVFIGYALLVAGMITVLATRVAQERAGAAPAPARPARSAARRPAAALLLAAGLAAWAPRAEAAALATPEEASRLGRLPVQHDGRVMPLDTLARETVRTVTGADSYRGADAVALVLGWRIDPEGWAREPLVRLTPGLAGALGLPPSTARASYADLTRNPSLRPLLEQAHESEGSERPPSGLEKEAARLEERLLAMQEAMTGGAFRAVPSAGDGREAWSPPGPGGSLPDLLAALEGRAGSRFASDAAIGREILYNRVRPTRLAWWILLPAVVCAYLAWSRSRPLFDALAITGLVAGFAVMTWGIAMRWRVAGRIPASNMYESLLFLGWGVGLFALMALLALRNRLVVLNATAMSALTMALTDLLPIDPFIHPMPPVLSGTPWLAIHVPIIMVSYSVLALGVVVAHMQIGVFIFAPARRELAFRMNDLLYWYTHVGAILLITGIFTGSIWASSSWGRYWGWDPKEVWSLVAFLAYLAILHGRFDRLIGPFGVAALSIVAFWTILMTYIGVNFVLTSGMHSYGFGSSGVVHWMLIVAACEGLFLTVGYLSESMRRETQRPKTAAS